MKKTKPWSKSDQTRNAELARFGNVHDRDLQQMVCAVIWCRSEPAPDLLTDRQKFLELVAEKVVEGVASSNGGWFAKLGQLVEYLGTKGVALNNFSGLAESRLRVWLQSVLTSPLPPGGHYPTPRQLAENFKRLTGETVSETRVREVCAEMGLKPGRAKTGRPRKTRKLRGRDN